MSEGGDFVAETLIDDWSDLTHSRMRAVYIVVNMSVFSVRSSRK